jgi:SapC
MPQIVPLDKEAQKSLKVDGRASAAYGDNQHFVQVNVTEFPQLVVHYPLFFSKNPNTGEFYTGVMLGLKEGENLFLQEWEQREI